MSHANARVVDCPIYFIGCLVPGVGNVYNLQLEITPYKISTVRAAIALVQGVCVSHSHSPSY